MSLTYERDYQSHRISVPERFNAVVDVVEAWAGEQPDAIALMSIGAQGQLDRTQSIGQLASNARRMAIVLSLLGAKKGDRVLIMLPRVPAWYTALLGVMRLGAIAVPTPNLSTSRDIVYRVKTARPTVIIADDVAAAKIDSARDELSSVAHLIEWSSTGSKRQGWHELDRLLTAVEDEELPADPTSRSDPLLIFFTSGTVSYPKMVLHAQSYALGHVGTARYWHNVGTGDRHWTVSDTGWAKAAWGGLFGQWHERATVVQANLSAPSARNILSLLPRHQITSFCAPPTLYRLLIQEDLRTFDFSSLRQCTSAGEPLNREVIRIWKEATGLIIRDGFGQSETTALVANTRDLPVRPGSMGKMMPGYEIAIVDEMGEKMPIGEIGNIAVRVEPRPVGLCVEYIDSPEQTAQSFRNGYYYTGDRGSQDFDGYFWFESRADDVITSSAYRIGPFEVESALLEHPAVVEAAVVGKDDERRTQIVCAFIILAQPFRASEALAKEIQEHVKRETAPYKYPREIHFVTDLPKTISGKIRRSELRRWLREGFPAKSHR